MIFWAALRRPCKDPLDRNDTSIADPFRSGGLQPETLETSGCTHRVQERSLLAPSAARLSLQAQPAGQDAGETRATVPRWSIFDCQRRQSGP